MLPRFKCKCCQWEWVARIDGTPRACPRCKTYYWQKGKPGAVQATNQVNAPNYPRPAKIRGDQIVGTG